MRFVFFFLCYLVNTFAVSFAVVGHSVRIEVGRLEGAQKSVPHAQPVRHDTVHVLDVQHTVVHQAPHLVQNCILNAIQCESLNFPCQQHWFLANLGHDLARAAGHLWSRPRRRHNFDQWHIVRWIDGMRHNQLCRSRYLYSNVRII